MVLVKEHVAKALEGQFLMARFFEATKGTAFAGKGLPVIIEGGHSPGIVAISPLGKLYPIFIMEKSKLRAVSVYNG
jgi:hypothetical protein